MHTVIGVMPSRSEADRLIQALVEAGVDKSHVSLLHKEPVEVEGDVPSRTLEGAETGAALGAVGALGLALVSLSVPGIGAAVALGPIALALGGAGAGAIAGGLMGAFADLGMEVDDARLFEEAVSRGGVLVAAYVEDDQVDRIAELFRSHGATEVAVREGTWHRHEEA